MNATAPVYGLWSLVLINSLVFIIFAFSFAKPQSRAPGVPATGKTAVEMFGEAYARGEISREEFLQKRHDVQKKQRTSLNTNMPFYLL